MKRFTLQASALKSLLDFFKIAVMIFIASLTSCNKDDVLYAVEPEVPEQPQEFDEVFPGSSYFQRATTKYTFAGRKVFISPIVAGQNFKWTIDGVEMDCTESTLCFTPDSPGEYQIEVLVDGEVAGQMEVVCVDRTERDSYRAGESKEVKVFEYVPAPGQFINETTSFKTHAEAVKWAQSQLADGDFVSLGGFGGYIVVGFGHSIGDFILKGNAYVNSGGASNEPGIVYVMQDVNGNGLPDDEWYELRGSETGRPSTVQNYSVTYYRPDRAYSSVRWVDCFQTEGNIDYMSQYHKQEFYYPLWISENSYTLNGTLVATCNERDSEGRWWNNPLDYGYADNVGGNDNEFHLSDAMYADLTPIPLMYADFIKIQTGVNGKSGSLGELSTEIARISEK